MSSNPPSKAVESSAEDISKLLDSFALNQKHPSDENLGPVYRFFTSTTTADLPNGASSSDPVIVEEHWFCPKAKSEVHREAATFLIFLLAFQGSASGKAWVQRLEHVLSGCSNCARGFGAARRRLNSRFMNQFTPQVNTNFTNLINKWQAQFIINEMEKSVSTYGISSGLLTLPTSYLQLFLNEPALLGNDKLSAALDTSISHVPDGPSTASTLGLTPVLIALVASSSDRRRQWALKQMQYVNRSLGYAEWAENGVGSEVQKLLVSSGSAEQWTALRAILDTNQLQLDTIQLGMLQGSYDAASKPRPDQSVMALIARVLGSPSPTFPLMFECFTTLLITSPTHHIWAFNTSPELPHTLFSDIKKNPSFQALLVEAHPSSGTDTKGKGRIGVDEVKNTFFWMCSYLLSVVDSEGANNASGLGFPEVLAKTVNFCFAEMQHNSLAVSARTAAAEAGSEVIIALQRRLKSTDPEYKALTATIEVHAPFIVSVAFQHNHTADWDVPRRAAQRMTADVFHADGRDIMESVLGLATIAFHERRRQRRKRRTKVVPPAVRVDRLHQVAVRRDLWSAAYNALSPSDPAGAALMMNAVAPFAHLESLNRHNAWDPRDLKEVVKEEDWIASVRAINAALKVTRDGFARSLESLAAQPDPTILQALWKQDSAAKAAVILLLSPSDSVHEPVISLIQQSFEDVDDRGDCFRVMLERFPHPAMDGLCSFLSTFILTAKLVPEACSIAKWLVRCFTDILDALCQASGSSPPLLQTDSFLSCFAEGKWMTRRLGDLWQLMTDSLALIFKRTSDWAPYYENDVMVDWMRDALIFGRGVTDSIRVFESAILSRTKVPKEDSAETPTKMTHVGKTLVQKLEVVLVDLVGWLRLTDSETLHQTFELIKTVVGRISKSNPTLSEGSTLETALLELDKFCRRVSSSYNCRLSDDLLSELSDLLEGFDLPLGGDEDVRFVKTVSSVESARQRTTSASASPAPTVHKASTPSSTATSSAATSSSKNAFAMMMKKAGGTYTATPAKSKPTDKTKPRQMTLQEFEDDTLLDDLPARDLDILERRAKADAMVRKPGKVQPPSNKLHINVAPRMYPPAKPTSSKFTSNFMKQLATEHKAHQKEMKSTAAATPRLPTPLPSVGKGLGVYTGPAKPKPVAEPSSDSSSASDSSDEENKGIGALINRQKAAPKLRAPQPERRSIKILGDSYADAIKEREQKRVEAQRMRQRLNPDLTPLFRYVLSWDPTSTGSRPPYPPKVAQQLGSLAPVPTTFARPEQYEMLMLPLFLQELWAQFIKDDQLAPPIKVEVATRAYEDEFIDIDIVVPSALPPGFFLNDTDIVTIRLENLADTKPIFAKVQSVKRKFKDTQIRLRIMNDMDLKGLGSKAKVVMRKHASLSTAIREYAALRGLPYYDLPMLSDILSARSASIPMLSDSQVRSAMNGYQVNEPQAKAIMGAMSSRGFSLIQGPPGTGKTKTISGLVGKFMAERKAFIPSVNGEPAVKTKLLVCAPSNAAIDEVCKRLMDGVPSPSGGRVQPNIVRLGVESSVNIACKDVSLDNIVESRVRANAGGSDRGGELAQIQAELEEIKKLVKDKQEQIQKAQGNDQKRKELESDYHQLSGRRAKLGQQLSKAKDAARDSTRHLDAARREARDTVLKEADIICATLSGAGQDSLRKFTFETVIIDEAAQAIEMSCLIPLKYGAKRCIMVGDPNQLPPTTFSQEAEANKFNQSLFVRMAQQRNAQMYLLSIQYRMHPDISELPSRVFYDSRLKDGPNMAAKTAAVWHRQPVFGPYRFFNVEGAEMKAGMSTKNPGEARAAVDLYRNLEDQFGDKINLAMRIGIITMYREQLYEIRRQFTDAFGPDILDVIDFNTVDGFQGQEKDIIILSCVRSGPNLQTIGFLKDFRRMNVALTRAKSSLFVIGNAATLERSDHRWRTIVGDARERGFLIDYKPDTFQARREESRLTATSRSAESGTVIPTVGTLPSKPSSVARKRQTPGSPDDAPPEKRPKATVPRPDIVIPSKNSPVNSHAQPSPVPSANSSISTSKPSAGPSNSGPASAAPPPGPPPRIPPPPPPRPAEDVLFMKKKKKPKPGNARPPGGTSGNVRASVNDHLAGGRRS